MLSDFTNFVHCDDLGTVSGINCLILGTCNIPVSTVDRHVDPVHFTFLNVFYVPSLSKRSCGNFLHLFSVRLAADAVFFLVAFDIFTHPSGIHVTLVRQAGLTWLPSPLLSPALLADVAPSTRNLIIHRRMGHLHEASLLKLDNLGILGVSGFSKLPPLSFCSQCATAKSTIADINRRSTRDRDPPHPFPHLSLGHLGSNFYT